jgi:hypothetical protein
MGGGSGNQTSTVYQSNLPQYAKPYYEALMDRGLSESQRPYQPYQGQRLAGESGATATGLGMSQDFANSSLGAYQNAGDMSGLAGLGGLNMMNYDPASISNSYNGPQQGNYQAGDITAQNVGSGSFGAAQAQQYMSPYMQDVIDSSKAQSVNDYLQQQAKNNADLGASGAFGGSRGQVTNMIAQNQLMQNLSQMQVKGLQSAYENAQGQYNADQNRALSAAQGNQQANLTAQQATEQSRQYGYGATESAYQKAADFGLQAQQATEQFRQSGADLGLKGLDIANQSASQMTQNQQALDAGALSRIKAQLGVGQTQEDYAQQSLDQAYNDFVNQRDSEKQNLQFLSSLLQGVPISANSDVQTTKGTNPLAGILGSATGLQALYSLGQQQG